MGLYWENGNRMETTRIFGGHIGIMEIKRKLPVMEKKLEALKKNVIFWDNENKMETTRMFCGYGGIMEKKWKLLKN